MRATQRCSVSFSIGAKYQDQVWCDVTSMDACHFLLGRLWQYDRHVKHYGHLNTYSFIKDNQKIVLASLKPSPPPIEPKKEALMLYGKKFVKELQDEPVAFALVLLEENESKQAKMHPLMQPILEEFHDVVPEDMPPGLPPLRDIEPQIDPSLGLVLPNKPAYRMNPKEHKELQRKWMS